MSRFYTQHEINKKEKQLTEDLLLNASKYKEELKQAINTENQRINIDSAKKKAVMQRMDYGGFHQMVLGANLRGTKTSELLDLQPKAVILNTVLTQQMMAKELDVLAGHFVINENEKKNENFIKFQENEFNIKEFYRNFRKIFKSLKSVEEKIEHLLQNIYFDEMINCDILESDFFLEIITTILTFILNKSESSNEDIKFLLNCLNSVCIHPKFTNLKKFIGKKQRNIIILINENIEEIFKNDEEKENLKLFEIIINYIN